MSFHLRRGQRAWPPAIGYATRAAAAATEESTATIAPVASTDPRSSLHGTVGALISSSSQLPSYPSLSAPSRPMSCTNGPTPPRRSFGLGALAEARQMSLLGVPLDANDVLGGVLAAPRDLIALAVRRSLQCSRRRSSSRLRDDARGRNRTNCRSAALPVAPRPRPGHGRRSNWSATLRKVISQALLPTPESRPTRTTTASASGAK
jgi:hypothetical protein